MYSLYSARVVLKAATQGVADAYRSHGRGLTFFAEATPVAVIAKAKRITVADRSFPYDNSDLICIGSS